MGWTCTYKEPGVKLTDWFIERGVLRWTNCAPYEYRVLDAALVHFVHYAAIERKHAVTGEREVFATVILTKSFREDASGHNFCWKELSEDMGPCEAKCPVRILDLLTPTNSEDANDWRQRCRRHAAILSGVPRLKPGMTLHFKDPLLFASGPISQLVVQKVNRSGSAICSSQQRLGRYKIKRSDLIKRAGGITVEQS